MSTSFTETLARLSAKPGVKSALVIDRSIKTVLQSTGSFAWLQIEAPATANGIAQHSLQDDGSQKEQGVETLALMVWNYVNTTETLVHNLDSEVCSCCNLTG
jgi:hypothetical protein